jgi:hypothetical protein
LCDADLVKAVALARRRIAVGAIFTAATLTKIFL